jgi:DNA end-binding protein Ku
VMTMATMRFADEVVSPTEITELFADDVEEPKKKELDMAKALIDSLAADFDADAYHDQYREELLSLIERKAKGESIVSAKADEPTPTKAPDLMAALEESLAAVRDEETKSNGKAKAKPKAKKPAASKTSSRSKAKTAK